MSIPTARDINPIPEDLNGRCAQEHFLGKSLAEAEVLFREASIIYQEDLMFMGVSAFRFYVQAVIIYIRSEASSGDSDIITCFASILESRLGHEAKELRPVASLLFGICGDIVEQYERFGVTLAIYGDMRPRFLALQQAFMHEMEIEK